MLANVTLVGFFHRQLFKNLLPVRLRPQLKSKFFRSEMFFLPTPRNEQCLYMYSSLRVIESWSSILVIKLSFHGGGVAMFLAFFSNLNSF